MKGRQHGKSIDLRAQFGRKFTEDEEAFEMAQVRNGWPTDALLLEKDTALLVAD